ncbi:hypothetical protein [Cellulomonas sp.]|uniref:hypothetical protein n=1 Tax=Cellulomonas sp. TaxID=40001 RepID=UPI001B2E7AD1|nr:hypothetical protein [Cellulomonas sp.]MBO9554946.1 hypothetical protein [Cellulomonas sp.]
MRTAYAQTAVVALAPGADLAGPGAAVTLDLCGSWDHEPPCPLAPHHTAVEDVDGLAHLRILFAAEPADEAEVRDRIGRALAGGAVDGPDGRTSRWTLVSTASDDVTADEEEHAARLTQS